MDIQLSPGNYSIAFNQDVLGKYADRFYVINK